MIMLLFVAFQAFGYELFESPLDIFSGFALFAALLLAHMDRRFERLYLTNRRLIKEQRLLRKRFVSVFLEQIQNLSYSNGYLGDIFGFGDIEVESVGVHGKIVFKGIISIKKNKRRIMRHINKVQKRR
ncbi:MAG: PH domain-containing protein [Deltaproteobacteria bacterium]|nr:PH domain-containing protein [Deltaproteobacteria bacterium]